ncbi:FAD/NAD(P)-binding domain-containing protein [Violaceomyces palustris]|uniref:FAD/NAD(P)-binding domain-containing protein n=1 Tax=Violaceomyces palustris TaxID=1673888 RepID=A0ACD0P1L4_9BASI|nr:FAD/NAD(P)-binding domain-containing protein [Violaceomyces palustris]
MTQQPFDARQTVLVIGGGACGLVTLRNLSQLKCKVTGKPLFNVQLVERREQVGGVWYWSDQTYSLERSLTPRKTQGLNPIFDQDGKPHWPSPAYLNLKGNVLPEFLTFSATRFPPPKDGEPFPTLRETHDYLLGFAEPLRPMIRCNVEVIRVEERLDGRWRVTLKDWANRSQDGQVSPLVSVRDYDRVVVAAGWYDNPVYPSTPGLDQALAKGLVHHAKHYRDSTCYAGKKVVVVGNNNSSNEAAAHIAVLNSKTHPVYKSARRPPLAKCPCLEDERIKNVGLIKRYQVVQSDQGLKARLELEDGSSIDDVDYILLGTGYGHSFPFVHVLSDETRSAKSELEEGNEKRVVQLTPPELQGVMVPSLHRHILFAKSENVSLAFIGMVVSYFPFNLADITSNWLAGVWAGEIGIPDKVEERLEDERKRLEYVWRSKEEALNNPEKASYSDSRPTSPCPWERGTKSGNGNEKRNANGVQGGEKEKQAQTSNGVGKGDEEGGERVRSESRNGDSTDEGVDGGKQGADLGSGEVKVRKVLNREDPFSRLGYHALASSTEGFSELEYGAKLRAEIVEAYPWLDEQLAKWDAERDNRRKWMYVRKREWLDEKREFIRSDPFDLLGWTTTNSKRLGSGGGEEEALTDRDWSENRNQVRDVDLLKELVRTTTSLGQASAA